MVAEGSESGDSLGVKAFAVLADRVASEVSDENSRLEEENSLLRPLREHLGSVEIRFDDWAVPLPGLENATIKREGELTCVTLQIATGPSLPLAKFRRVGGADATARMYMSKQVVGRFSGRRCPTVRDVSRGSLVVMMSDASGDVFIRGRLDNLSSDDWDRVMDEGESVKKACRTIGHYLCDGEEWSSPNATFTPDFIFMVISVGRGGTGIRKTIGLLHCPLFYEQQVLGKQLRKQLQQNIDKVMYNLNMLQDKYTEARERILDLNLQQSEEPTEENQLALYKWMHVLEAIEDSIAQSQAAEQQVLDAKELLDNQAAHYEGIFEHGELKAIELEENLSPADDLRNMIFAIDDRPGNMKLLMKNRKLKFERENLADIQTQIGAIEISESNETFKASIGEGFFCTVDDGQVLLRISLSKGRGQFTDVNKLHDLEVSLSGVRLEKKSGLAVPVDALTLALEIRFDSTPHYPICLRGHLQFEEIDSLEGLMENELFPHVITSILSGRSRSIRFPPDCTVKLTSIDFDLSFIKDSLEMTQLQPLPVGTCQSSDD